MITSPIEIILTDTEKTTLHRRVRAHSTEVRLLDRARIILAAAAGLSNAAIARTIGLHTDTVRKWRSRFHVHRLPGLADAPRPGRPPIYTALEVAEVKALACTSPDDSGLPLARWSTAELADQARQRGISASVATIDRWLGADAIKPWQHQSWIFPRDPDFAAKGGRVLDLYDRTYQGVPLGPNDYVISADEKSQLQAVKRKHPGLPAGPGQPRRVEFEYTRGGTLAYFAAYDVHHAKVIGRIEDTTGIAPFSRLVEQVMTTEPYASADRVFWIVDNGSSHAGQTSIDRMQAAWPNAQLVHLPVHASWLNQVEIYFSILQRKAINPADFTDLDQLAQRVMAFQDHYNHNATPFDWRYSRDDLNDLIQRLDAKEFAQAA